MACVTAALLPQWFIYPRTTAWLQPALCNVLHSQLQLRLRGAVLNHRHSRLQLKHHETTPSETKPKKKYWGKHYIHTAATTSASKLILKSKSETTQRTKKEQGTPFQQEPGKFPRKSWAIIYLAQCAYGVGGGSNNALWVCHSYFFGQIDHISLERSTSKMELRKVWHARVKPTVVPSLGMVLQYKDKYFTYLF